MRRRRRLSGCLAGLLVVMLTLGARSAHGQLTMGASLNPLCINMRITYTTCGIIPYPCAVISFWQPKWIVGVKSAVRTQGSQHDHFHDVVVRPMTVGFEFNDPCMGCVVPRLAAVVPAFYESFTDPAWRTAQSPLMSPEIVALQVGLWGGYYPRVGFVTHPSPVAASGLAATRGFDIAREPIDLWPVAGLLRPTIPLVPNAQTIVLPCMQLNIPPVPYPCFRAGFDFGLLMTAPAMPGGIYEWVIWKRKSCTLPLPLNFCAEALNALPKGNLCF